MSWTTKAQIGTAMAVAGTELYSTAVTLKSDETAHVQVRANFIGSPTDDLEVRIYTTQDLTAETWDTTTFETAVTLDKATDPNIYSLTVTGAMKFRVGVVRSGATDTITTDIWYIKNGDYHDCSLDI